MARGEGIGWEVLRLLHSLPFFAALKVPLVGPLTLMCLNFSTH